MEIATKHEARQTEDEGLKSPRENSIKRHPSGLSRSQSSSNQCAGVCVKDPRSQKRDLGHPSTDPGGSHADSEGGTGETRTTTGLCNASCDIESNEDAKPGVTSLRWMPISSHGKQVGLRLLESAQAFRLER
jgi:hypothetical protein